MVFGSGLMSVFVPIYLFQIGYPIYQILLFFAMISLSYLLVSVPVAKVVAGIGVNHAMLLSAPFTIAYYLGLDYVPSHPYVLYILPLVIALGWSLMNFGYHMNYILHSNKRIRGGEVSLSYMMQASAKAASPFVGALIAEWFGFRMLFFVGSIALFMGYVPLFFNSKKKFDVNVSFSSIWEQLTERFSVGTKLSFVGYAIESRLNVIIWPLFLLIHLGTISKTGLTLSATTLISIVVFGFAGSLTDRYNDGKLINVGTILFSVSWIARMFVTNLANAIAINSYNGFMYKFLSIPWNAKNYDLMERDIKHIFDYIVSREIVYKSSRVIVLPLVAFLFYFAPHPFYLSFIVAAVFATGYAFLGKGAGRAVEG
jgi:MFS family permease